MSRSMSISEARARLPELARYLRRSPRQVVFIEHRDMDERLALVTESHLHYLESLVTAAERRRASSFKLAGSMKSDLPDEEIEEALAAIKKEQGVLSEGKARKF